MTGISTSAHTAKPTSPFLPYLALAIGVVGMGFSAVFVKWANVPGPVSGFYRMIIATVFMALPFASQVQKRRPLSARHVWLAVLAGLLFALDLAAWNTGVLITSATNATLLGNTAPIWVSLGAMILFKEKLRPAFWGGLALAMTGAFAILGGDFIAHPVLGFGDLLSLLAGLFYGAFFLAAERARQGLNSLITWWIAAASSTVALLIVAILFDNPLWGFSLKTYLSLAALAFITQIGGYLLVNYALGHLPASIVSPTLLAQPVFTALFAVPLLGEAITPLQIISGVAVLSGIYIVHRQKQR